MCFGVKLNAEQWIGIFFVIISVALGLSEFLTVRQIPMAIVDWLASYELGPVGFILLLFFRSIAAVIAPLLVVQVSVILCVAFIAVLGYDRRVAGNEAPHVPCNQPSRQIVDAARSGWNDEGDRPAAELDPRLHHL